MKQYEHASRHALIDFAQMAAKQVSGLGDAEARMETAPGSSKDLTGKKNDGFNFKEQGSFGTVSACGEAPACKNANTLGRASSQIGRKRRG